MTDKIYLQYEDLHKYTDNIIEQIQTSNFKPDIVLAVAMGGLMIGYLLTKGLKIDNFQSIHTKSYQDHKRCKINDLTHDIHDFADMNVLLVDDLADSGKTLEYIQNKYLSKSKSVQIATRIYKTHSTVKPDFFAKTFNSEWIVFPYETYE